MAFDFSCVNKEIMKVLELLPTMYDLLDDTSIVTVMDSEGTVVGYQIPEGQEPLKQIGEHMDDPSGGFDEVLRTGKRKYNYLPKEVMGVAFEGYLVPIKDEGVVVGVIIYTHEATKKDEILETADRFEKAINVVDDSIQGVLDSITELGKSLESMIAHSNSVQEDIGTANSIISSISNNASRSNILALNASIEAARSGNAGKGFAVVAKEMGNLSQSSSVSAKEIATSLRNIESDMDSISADINKSGEISKENVESIAAIKNELQTAVELAKKLKDTWK